MAHPVTAGASRRTRQRRRAAITFVLVLAFLGSAFWYAYSYIKNGAGTSATPSAGSSCTTNPYGSGALPKDVTLNVYNASKRAGLASDVARTLKARGFTVVEIANDPLEKKVPGVGELRYGPPGQPQALTAVKLVKGLVRVNDKRTDATVDLVLGDKFTGLAPERKCAPAAT